MTEPKTISLKEFMQSRKPDGIHGLVFFKNDIVTLYASGYSLKSILEYVQANGYKAGYSAMCKWISKHMNLEQEAIEFMQNGGVRVEKSNTEAATTTASSAKPKSETSKPEVKTQELPTVSPSEIKQDQTPGNNTPQENPTPKTNAETIEKMKASMDKLLGGETFDDQFAALKNENNPGDLETGR